MQSHWRLALLGLALLAACTNGAGAPTSTATLTSAASPSPAATVASPTALPSPSVTAIPSSTTASSPTAATTASPPPSPTASPTAAPFYAQVTYIAGFPVKGSAKVRPEAVKAAAETFGLLVFGNATVVNRMRSAGVWVAVIAQSEMLTDLPEFIYLRGSTTADGRAYDDMRALGALPCVAGEENLLGLIGDIYGGANILVHECAHAVYFYGLDPQQRARWIAIYGQAMKAGRWSATYAAANPEEFFAELTESYFGLNARPQPGVHNDVNGPERLAAYDPDAYAFLLTIYTPHSG